MLSLFRSLIRSRNRLTRILVFFLAFVVAKSVVHFLFGLFHPARWHVGELLLESAVTAIVFDLLRIGRSSTREP